LGEIVAVATAANISRRSGVAFIVVSKQEPQNGPKRKHHLHIVAKQQPQNGPKRKHHLLIVLPSNLLTDWWSVVK
jgi:hypothetical protein